VHKGQRAPRVQLARRGLLVRLVPQVKRERQDRQERLVHKDQREPRAQLGLQGLLAQKDQLALRGQQDQLVQQEQPV